MNQMLNHSDPANKIILQESNVGFFIECFLGKISSFVENALIDFSFSKRLD